MVEKKKRRAKRGTAKATPGYCRHRDAKRGDRAFVLLDGKRTYLGEYGSPESRSAYDRAVAEYLANGRQVVTQSEDDSGTFVVEIIAAYWEYAKGHYRRKDGTSTGTPELKIRYALRPLRELYGDTPASEFGPLRLEAVRTHMVSAGLSRNVVNQRVSIVRGMFKWAESKEMVPSGTFHNLSTLAHLKPNRTDAHETEKVKSVSWQDVTATVEHLAPQIAAMVMLQWETGARPGEVVVMRDCDIDRVKPGMWVYSPPDHKTAHREKERHIPLFETSQEYLRPFLEDIEVGRDPTLYLFRPDGHRARHGHYSPTHYAQAVRRGIAAANAPARHDVILEAILPMMPVDAHERLSRAVRRMVTNLDAERVGQAIEKQAIRLGFDAAPIIAAVERVLEDHEDIVAAWSPNQLRHSAATRIERLLSVEEARVILGHSSSKTTRGYLDEPETKRVFDAMHDLEIRMRQRPSG